MVNSISSTVSSSAQSAAPIGVGDDCALLNPRQACAAISTDLHARRRHSLHRRSGNAAGRKALAVNSATWPPAAPALWPSPWRWPCPRPWMPGWRFLAQPVRAGRRAHCELIGGDTTRGPLAICRVRRGAAGTGAAAAVAPGPATFCTSAALGDAWLALRCSAARAPRRRRLKSSARASTRPRVALGLALPGGRQRRPTSDGLVGDLVIILKASGAGPGSTPSRSQSI